MIIDFKLDYDSNGLLKTPAYPDVPKLLDTLHAAGIAMHIATNKRLAPSRTILQHLGLAGYFTSINALDMATPLISNKATLIAEMMPRHNMVPSTTLYVGDKMEDGYAAEANGVRFYAARWGYGVFPPKDTFTNWLQADSPTDLMLQILAASG
jgi:phosphoglycolate phosphatase